EPELRGARSIDDLACGDQLDRGQEPDQAGQARASAPGRQDAQLHLGEAELRLVRRHPCGAGERELEAASDAQAVDERDGRRRQAGEALEGVLTGEDEALDLRIAG